MYSFDLQGRMDTHSTVTPSGSVETDYDYDNLGRLDTQTESNAAGQVVASYDYDVRPDGKRVSLSETHWFDDDADGDNVRDASEVLQSQYDWTYYAAGRLTDEALNHWDDAVDVSESFVYDLTGNRVGLQRDAGNDSVVDQALTYEFDANDRLLHEYLDSDNNGGTDQTIVYGYDHTQQTEKTLYNGFVDDSRGCPVCC